jgi:hypothetical protein
MKAARHRASALTVLGTIEIVEGDEIVLNLYVHIDAQTAAVVDSWVAEDQRQHCPGSCRRSWTILMTN